VLSLSLSLSLYIYIYIEGGNHCPQALRIHARRSRARAAMWECEYVRRRYNSGARQECDFWPRERDGDASGNARGNGPLPPSPFLFPSQRSILTRKRPDVLNSRKHRPTGRNFKNDTHAGSRRRG